MNDYLKYTRKAKKRKAFLVVAGTLLLVLALPMWMKIYVSQAQSPEKYEMVMVSPGDTLWKIARREYGPETDIRPIIYEIRKINNLDNAVIIRPGQVLLLPKE